VSTGTAVQYEVTVRNGRFPLPLDDDRVVPVLAILVGVVAFVVLFLTAGAVGAVLGPVALAGAIVGAVVHHNRTQPAATQAPPPPPPAVVRPGSPPPPRPETTWADAWERFDRLSTEYAAFECDAMAVLRLPALADVSVPSTARFVDAFAEAQALHTDRFPGPGHGTRFVGAVQRAEPAWRAAQDAARRIRLSGLDPAVRATVHRVIKLLTTARDSGSEPERLAAYSLARTELRKLDDAGVLSVPEPARAALDVAARGQLAAGEPPTGG
jgi:hypothetical protein